MHKNLHIVFPKEHMEILLRELSKYEEYKVTGTDFHFNTFHDFAMSNNNEIDCDIALIIGDIEGDIPLEEKVDEFLRKMTDICFNCPKLKFIISLPKSYEHIKIIQQTLVSLSVYDIYFTDEIQFDTLIDWIENPKSLADMKEFILSTKELKQESETLRPNTTEKEVPSEKIEKEESRTNRRKKRSKEVEIRSTRKIVEKIVSISQRNIAFISNSKGAGSTFHATNFSAFLSNNDLNVGLYESPIMERGRTYLVDLFDLSDATTSIPHAIYKNLPINQENIAKYKEISVYPVNKKENLKHFTADMMFRYINIGRHTLKIVDLGYYGINEENKGVLQFFDHIYIIVDLSPIAFIPNFERFECLNQMKNQKGFPSIDFILNPYVSSFPKQELKELGLNKAYRCETFERELIMDAYFNKKVAYDGVEEIQEEFNELYQALCHDINIPLQKIEARKKFGFFNKIGLF